MGVDIYSASAIAEAEERVKTPWRHWRRIFKRFIGLDRKEEAAKQRNRFIRVVSSRASKDHWMNVCVNVNSALQMDQRLNRLVSMIHSSIVII